MATMHPKKYAGGVWAEEQVFNALRELPDPWHVVADVYFPIPRDADPALDGQVDFVLLHPELGGIVLEVKGGSGIGVEDGHWWSENREGRYPIKNPYQQASGYKYTLKKLIEERTGVAVWFGHAVAFPSTSSVHGSIGMTGPEQLTIMRNDLDAIAPALDRIVRFLGPPRQRLSGRDVEKVVRALAPTAVITVDLADGSDDVRRKQVELTQQQHAVLESVANWPRAWVKGAAGTGKTVLAISRAQQLAQAGKRTMLVCFNQALGDHLAAEITDGSIDAGHFHRLAAQLGGPRPAGMSEFTWRERGCADLMLEACLSAERTWDAIVVDEAQDFDPYWIEVLETLLTPDGVLVAFADENQQLFRRELIDLPELPLELTINCRNTRGIATCAGGPLQVVWDERRCADGPIPELFVVDGDPTRKIRSVVHAYIGEGNLKPERVAILSTSRELVDELSSGQIGRWTTVRAGQLGLVCDTVHRFKGLEADAVVLVLPEDRVAPVAAYVGMSRARTLLTVIASAAAAESIRWPINLR